MAKATHTISSTLDDLQLDITLRIHERISEFLSLWHYPPSLRNHRDARTHSVERRRGSGSEAGQEVGRELPSPSLFKEEVQWLKEGKRFGGKTLCLPLFNAGGKLMPTGIRGDAPESTGRALD